MGNTRGPGWNFDPLGKNSRCEKGTLNGMSLMSEERFEEFLRQSEQYLRTVIAASKAEFKLDSYQRYDWDQWRGELVFSSKGIPKVVAQIQFVGSISTKTNTWLWAWANPSFLEPVRRSVLRVREFGKEHGLNRLTQDKWEAEEVDGWEMTAVAARLLEAKGAYRSPDENGFTFMVFTDLREASDRDNIFATFSCVHVLQEKLPVLYFSKEANGDIQALCGGIHRSAEECRVVHLEHLAERDASLEELADLPAGWIAEREKIGAAWKRSKGE